MSSISAEGWVLIIGAVAAGIGGLYAALQKGRKEKRADAITEWKDYAGDLKKQIADQGVEIRGLTAEVFKLHDAHAAAVARGAACEAHAASLEGELKLMQSALQRLQGLAGDAAPATSAPGLIIADVHGNILEYTVGLIPLLHWLPKDVRGKNVEMFIPERYLEAHRKGLALIKAADVPPWTEKTINGYALTKENGEVAVAITLSAWKTAKGEWLISAEVKKRSATTLVMDKEPK